MTKRERMRKRNRERMRNSEQNNAIGKIVKRSIERSKRRKYPQGLEAKIRRENRLSLRFLFQS